MTRYKTCKSPVMEQFLCLGVRFSDPFVPIKQNGIKFHQFRGGAFRHLTSFMNDPLSGLYFRVLTSDLFDTTPDT